MARFSEIEKFLKEKNIDFDVIDLPATAVSVDDVIRLTGGRVKEDEIVKTLIVKAKSGDFVACILKGRDRIDMNKGQFDRLAKKEEVERIAQVEVGAVCPILLGIPIIIDNQVSKLERVNMGSGDLLKGLEMKLSDLLKVLKNYEFKNIT